MEYLAGVTLDRMIAGRSLTLQIVMKYALEIADALIAAHAAGIIHRDLKLGNIIITEDGRTKLLDFGLAQFCDAVSPPAETETRTLHTMPGTILGTPAYMSPEQAQGRPLDARSDIFAFGLVVYEMLSGQRAFSGDSWVATIAATLYQEPAPLGGINPAVPRPVEECVSRCLRKDPAQRFAGMAEVRQALEAKSVDTGEDASSIAVLPFVNLSADRENEYFGDGLAEEIINALAKVPKLRVIARTSSFAFRSRAQDLRTIGQRLRVATVLDGTVRRAGNRIRVTAQLICAADEQHLWSDRYDREMTDIFAIQDEISQAIADALKVHLAATTRPTSNVEAYQHYLHGLYWFQRYTRGSLPKAREGLRTGDPARPRFRPAVCGFGAVLLRHGRARGPANVRDGSAGRFRCAKRVDHRRGIE